VLPLKTLRIALAQVNTTVGDLDGNVQRILAYLQRAREAGADMVVFPELTVTGYPPEDLLPKPSFIAANRAALNEVALATDGLTVVVGFTDADEGVCIAAAVLPCGGLAGVYRKQYLPTAYSTRLLPSAPARETWSSRWGMPGSA
jgi:NAD+ synthase (glutamine-hydrolysing)